MHDDRIEEMARLLRERLTPEEQAEIAGRLLEADSGRATAQERRTNGSREEQGRPSALPAEAEAASSSLEQRVRQRTQDFRFEALEGSVGIGREQAALPEAAPVDASGRVITARLNGERLRQEQAAYAETLQTSAPPESHPRVRRIIGLAFGLGALAALFFAVVLLLPLLLGSARRPAPSGLPAHSGRASAVFPPAPVPPIVPPDATQAAARPAARQQPPAPAPAVQVTPSKPPRRTAEDHPRPVRQPRRAVAARPIRQRSPAQTSRRPASHPAPASHRDDGFDRGAEQVLQNLP